MSGVTEGTDPTQELRFDRTQEIPTEALQTQQPAPGQKDYKTGVAAVPAQRQVEHTVSFEPTLAPGQIVTSGHLKRPDVPFGVRMRQLKAGGRWSVAGAIFLLVSWGLWAASAGVEQRPRHGHPGPVPRSSWSGSACSRCPGSSAAWCWRRSWAGPGAAPGCPTP